MSFLAMLLVWFALLHLPPLRRLRPLAGRRGKAAFALAFGFLVTGVLHFSDPGRFLAMMPPWLPWHLELVYLSGILELLGAVGLMLPGTRRLAGFGLAALLIAIFPANVHVALSGGTVEGLPEARWYYWLRLPLQIIFIGWALWCSKTDQQGTAAAEPKARPRT